MKKLINLSTDPWDTNKFLKDPEKIYKFMQKHSLDGLEIIQSFEKWDSKIIPSPYITGLHMPFWPIWLDFWNSNKAELEKQFGLIKVAQDYYGGKDQEIFIKRYLDECCTAKKWKLIMWFFM